MKFPFDPSEVSLLLLTWYGQHGRDLPWRHTRDPYRIWLSEIMLQQTTVTAVIPYYEKFLQRFADVRTLAAADQEAVLELWSGLGYYSRARNLHKAAQFIVDECEGLFPDSVERLMQLPGVGRSTAGAIVSIAFDKAAPILDGNVRRVLVRLMALQKPPRDRESEKLLWSWAEDLTPTEKPHDYAQAIMDLGATICLPRRPDCGNCPLRGICLAKKEGLENMLPVTAKKGKLPERRQLVLIVKKNNRLLVRRRPANGLLGGMWEFPCVDQDDGEAAEQKLQALARDYFVQESFERVGSVNHVYSHFQLEVDIYRAECCDADRIAQSDSFWHDADSLVSSPLHGAHQKVLKLIMEKN